MRLNIRAKEIEKKYGKKTVLNKISLTVETNSNYCLLGRNGAGKSTLINIFADLVKADYGEIKFGELNYNNNELFIKQNIGLLTEKNFLIEELSGLEYLKFVGKLYRIPKDDLDQRINSLSLYFFNNLDDIQKTISSFSTGMKKKLMFCTAVIHRPNILILDEPFSGLDPVAANLLVEFLNKYRNANRVIFLSSHNLNYIAKVATHIGILENGKIIFDGTLNSFLENGTKNIDDSLLKKLNMSPSETKGIEWIF